MLAKELIALGVNLSLNGRNADLMAQGDGLKLLLRRLLKTHDPMLMKVRCRPACAGCGVPVRGRY